MLVLLSCAKTMSETSKVKVPLKTVPRFQKEASGIALQMSQFSVDELERLLRINARMAVENYKRYQAFHAEDTSELPALLAYTGIVFKRLNAKDFSKEEFEYAQEHLRLTSFCYGLLRPLDVIRSYRLEGDVVLPEPSDGCLHRRYKESGRHTLQSGQRRDEKFVRLETCGERSACRYSRISGVEEREISFDSDLYQDVPW